MSTDKTDEPQPAPGQAQHGARSEVTWESGLGRQPYSNRGPEEGAEPNFADDEVPEGDRGQLSGRNLEQLERAKVKP
jgi:hypothetical protein